MGGEREIWLVRNEASGSNDDEAMAALEECCGNAGFDIWIDEIRFQPL